MKQILTKESEEALLGAVTPEEWWNFHRESRIWDSAWSKNNWVDLPPDFRKEVTKVFLSVRNPEMIWHATSD